MRACDKDGELSRRVRMECAALAKLAHVQEKTMGGGGVCGVCGLGRRGGEGK